MSVDAEWLEGVRRKNQKALGMAGLSGMGYVSSEGLVTKAREERDLRTESIHAGRFTPAPTEGTVESVARAIGPANVPAPQPIPKGLAVAAGVVVVGLSAFLLYKITRG